MAKENLDNAALNVHYLFDNEEANSKNFAAYDQMSLVSLEVEQNNFVNPVYFIRPNAIAKASEFFLQNFIGGGYLSRVLYSVKSNADEDVLKILFDNKIRNFDVASIAEIELVNKLFGNVVKQYFMHPVKPRESISKAYFDYGVRDFSLDSFEELDKIVESTKEAKDLNLHVRIAIPNAHVAIDLTGKFGILPLEAIELLKEVRKKANKVGVCFHVGSQCMESMQYRSSLEIIKDILDQSGVEIDVLDIGGGFPSSYPGMIPTNLSLYFDEIFDAISKLNLKTSCEIWCEPGRALVAEAASLLVRVEGRKQNMLYINDGTYGGLFDAGSLNFIYPVKAHRVGDNFSGELQPFGFYGPTCDSLDTMKGPFYLPQDIKEGDYIEIGQLGAYSAAMRSNFNGFGSYIKKFVKDKPLLTNYDFDMLAPKTNNNDKIIKLNSI